MLRAIVPRLEKHHGVRILDEAVCDAVKLSHRYISERYLPDKAIGVLDTACARVAVSRSGTPPVIEAAIYRIERLEMEIGILEREKASGRLHTDRIKELGAELAGEKSRRDALAVQWEKELSRVKKIQALEAELSKRISAETGKRGRGVDDLAGRVSELERELRTIQGEEPMVPSRVDPKVIASVISSWTGIPVGKMLKDDVQTVLDLKERREEQIIGQPQALDAICRRISTSRAGLEDPGKPLGVFLLIGPSGIGKTETALTLADILYGGERSMVAVNMSEYQEAHTVSGLKGAPPGYVGYGTGGVLTEAVRRNPYSVVLLDEVEKAHPDVLELFYQVFDKGTIEDSEGIAINFKNTIILLTSNLGSEIILRACSDGTNRPEPEALVEAIRPILLRRFKPAFLGRLSVVPYYPLGDDEIGRIVRLKLAKIQKRFRDNHRAELTCSEPLVKAIAARCTEVDSGARNIDHILNHSPSTRSETGKDSAIRSSVKDGADSMNLLDICLIDLTDIIEDPPRESEADSNKPGGIRRWFRSLGRIKPRRMKSREDSDTTPDGE
jgi:type VI secretion system protein VasG